MTVSTHGARPGRVCGVGAPQLLSTLLWLLTVACSGGGGGDPGAPAGWTTELRVAPTPPGVGEARVVVTVEGPEGPPPPQTVVEVEGRMREESQGAVLRTTTSGRPGTYEVEAFPFSTAGEWVLTVRVSPPAGPMGEWTFPVRAVAAPPRLGVP